MVDPTSNSGYYITRYNGGRPFFVAGHSLGSNVIANLLASYMPTHPDVDERMIAAYVVGYSIMPDYLAQNPTLAFAHGVLAHRHRGHCLLEHGGTHDRRSQPRAAAGRPRYQPAPQRRGPGEAVPRGCAARTREAAAHLRSAG